MKKIFLAIIVVLLTGLISSSCYGAIINLKATWTMNTETDVVGYNLYRTDGTRLKLNPTLIPHPAVQPYLFSVTVPDNSSGTMTFVLTAVDTSNLESLDSDTASKTYDLVPPAKPAKPNITF
jgi:hypothetical protein